MPSTVLHTEDRVVNTLDKVSAVGKFCPSGETENKPININKQYISYYADE